MSVQPQVTWLTQAAFDRLTAELEELSTTGRAEVAARIAAARDEGDLKENGGYHAAREEQGKMEARIAQLTEMLKHAVVGEAADDDGIVASGMVITAKILGDEERFLIGSREIASDDINVYSEQSPLGQAILGRKVGDSTDYLAPNGKRIPVEILSAVPYEG